MKINRVKTYVSRLSSLSRWDVDTSLIKQASKTHKNKGLFYHKGGAGIETNPNSKRKPSDTFNMRKVKGESPRRNMIVREKSKYETNNPFTGK